MAKLTPQADLFPSIPRDTGAVVINDRCLLRTDGVNRVVLFAGLPLASFAAGDRMAEAHAMVSLVNQGYADQNDVARAFACAARTVRRHQRRYEEEGLVALGRPGGYPKGKSRLKSSHRRRVTRLKSEGLSNREIARRLGVCEKAVRKLLRRLGFKESTPIQMPLPIEAENADPNLSAFVESPLENPSGSDARTADPNLSAFHDDDEPSFSLDNDPADRRLDRMLAYLGLMDDAAPRFANVTGRPKAAVLMALPALVESGVFDVARSVYGAIGPAFYGLRTCLVILLLMALLRIKRPEAIKEHVPADLGAIVGLDRAPEVKTLRRKLARLAAFGKASEFGHALAARRIAARGKMMGFLYIDGHVRVYHGQRLLPKAHVARLRFPMPATTDYWVNDAAGDPLFVVTAEANAGLCKILPDLIHKIRTLVGERRVTVVFDRGGWSPKLFKTIIANGFDILTYRKGRIRPVPRKLFAAHELSADGRTVKYTLADTGVRLRNGLRLRQVTRLSDDGTHQTPIITSRRDLAPAEVAIRMFERWRQENFFKYLREEYALDALADYAVEPDNPARDVPNPRWRRLDKELRKAKSVLARLATAYGVEAVSQSERLRAPRRSAGIARGNLDSEIQEALKRVAAIRVRRKMTPQRVPVADTVAGEVVKLAPERKLLTNILKQVAYQAESDLYRMVAPYYKRAMDEGRTLIQAALASAADIEATDTELRICIAPQSSAHRSRAISALCKELNQTNTLFPGTKLRLRYAVKGQP
jgi:transposase